MFIIIICYFLLILLKLKLRDSYLLPFTFFDGIMLAYVCFKVLPDIFINEYLWAGVGTMSGVIFCSILENKYFDDEFSNEIINFFMYIIIILFDVVFKNNMFLVKAVLSGITLYISSNNLFMENKKFKNTVISAIYGVLGFVAAVIIYSDISFL